MAIYKCKMCGGELTLVPGSVVCTCEYCGTKQTVPSADNEKKLMLFARANRILRDCEFDKAAGVFESIVVDFPQEAEAYWGLVLCKYGIEYVDDPATGKKVPTCHRSSFESVQDDANYQQAIRNADTVARDVYIAEAAQIEALRREIIAVSSRTEPYDVFICYKETDERGGRTEDSVIAQEVYNALTEKGYRVFFSRITLESMLGSAYEPRIFAALNSAKVMLAFGTDIDRFEAVWVRNEWSRFLQLIAKGEKKTLIPCYKGMRPGDMPKEFAHLQAQDMGKLGAVQDLVRGIEKIVPIEKKAAEPAAPSVQPAKQSGKKLLFGGIAAVAVLLCVSIVLLLRIGKQTIPVSGVSESNTVAAALAGTDAAISDTANGEKTDKNVYVSRNEKRDPSAEYYETYEEWREATKNEINEKFYLTLYPDENGNMQPLEGRSIGNALLASGIGAETIFISADWVDSGCDTIDEYLCSSHFMATRAFGNDDVQTSLPNAAYEDYFMEDYDVLLMLYTSMSTANRSMLSAYCLGHPEPYGQGGIRFEFNTCMISKDDVLLNVLDLGKDRSAGIEPVSSKELNTVTCMYECVGDGYYSYYPYFKFMPGSHVELYSEDRMIDVFRYLPKNAARRETCGLVVDKELLDAAKSNGTHHLYFSVYSDDPAASEPDYTIRFAVVDEPVEPISVDFPKGSNPD